MSDLYLIRFFTLELHYTPQFPPKFFLALTGMSKYGITSQIDGTLFHLIHWGESGLASIQYDYRVIMILTLSHIDIPFTKAFFSTNALGAFVNTHFIRQLTLPFLFILCLGLGIQPPFLHLRNTQYNEFSLNSHLLLQGWILVGKLNKRH